MESCQICYDCKINYNIMCKSCSKSICSSCLLSIVTNNPNMVVEYIEITNKFEIGNSCPFCRNVIVCSKDVLLTQNNTNTINGNDDVNDVDHRNVIRTNNNNDNNGEQKEDVESNYIYDVDLTIYDQREQHPSSYFLRILVISVNLICVITIFLIVIRTLIFI